MGKCRKKKGCGGASGDRGRQTVKGLRDRRRADETGGKPYAEARCAGKRGPLRKPADPRRKCARLPMAALKNPHLSHRVHHYRTHNAQWPMGHMRDYSPRTLSFVKISLVLISTPCFLRRACSMSAVSYCPLRVSPESSAQIREDRFSHHR